MATQTLLLAEINLAVLSIDYDDIALTVLSARVNCTNAVGSVNLTVFNDADEVVLDEQFNPGQDITRNIPPGQRPSFSLELKVRPIGGDPVLQMTRPHYLFRSV